MVQVWMEDWENETDVSFSAEALMGIPLAVGKSVAGRFPESIHLRALSSSVADFFYAGPMFVVAKRLMRLLMSFSADVEYFDLALERGGGILPGEFYCVNILQVIDCLDWEASKYDVERNFASSIREFRLNYDSMPEVAPLFRVARTIPSIVCASGELADAVREAGLSGVKFVSPENWENLTLP